MAAADAKAAHDVVIDAIERSGDRGIGFGQREEGLPPQPAQNAGVAEAHAVLDLGLVLRPPWPGRQDADA